MYVMIDNYDSFVYNLIAYMEELGVKVRLIRNDQVDLVALQNMLDIGQLEGLVISPGPKTPQDCGQSREVVLQFAGKIPILGVCLGMQVIGSVYGAVVEKGERPMHGKVSRICTNQKYLFRDLPETFSVTRYHSLVVKQQNLPDCLKVTARSEDGVIQGIRHSSLPVFGVQFHPEAVMTEFGYQILGNYIRICKEWRKYGAYTC